MEVLEMTGENEEFLKKRLEKAMVKSIKSIIETFKEYPMFYINEEDIRCELYRKVSKAYGPYKISLKNIKNGDIFESNAIHSDAKFCIKNKIKDTKPYPDLLVYFSENNASDSIPVTITDDDKPENVYFLEKSEEESNKKRIIVEVKFTDHKGSIHRKIKEKIVNDLKKISKWEVWKKYILFFDRSNKLDTQIIKIDNEKINAKQYLIDLMKKMSKDKLGDIEFYYFGMPTPGKEEQIYHYVNGILK